jgi:hypothetical protein
MSSTSSSEIRCKSLRSPSLRSLSLRSSSIRSKSLYASTLGLALSAVMAVSCPIAHAAQLSNDAKSAIPHDVQQIIVVDYRAMQNSPAAMSLKDRVLPPELKRLETALVNSGLKVDQDADTLAFAAFRAPSPDGRHRAGTVPHP